MLFRTNCSHATSRLRKKTKCINSITGHIRKGVRVCGGGVGDAGGEYYIAQEVNLIRSWICHAAAMHCMIYFHSFFFFLSRIS